MIFNQLLIRALNRILDANLGSRKILAQFSNNSFYISLFGINLAGQIDIDGFILPPPNNNYTVSINIPTTASSYLINNDKLDLYKKIQFSGDNKFGRALLETLANIHLTGIYSQIDSPIGIFAINQINKLTTSIKKYLSMIASNATVSVKEYLLYESQDLATKSENNYFCTEVDELRAHIDRLAAKIQLLIKSSKSNRTPDNTTHRSTDSQTTQESQI